MPLTDFLLALGFWQWIGLLMLVTLVGSFLAAAAYGLGQFRVVDCRRYTDIVEEDDEETPK